MNNIKKWFKKNWEIVLVVIIILYVVSRIQTP